MSDPNLSPAERQAIRWWVAAHSGEWGGKDAQELDDWLAADPAHRQAYARVARTWGIAGELAEAGSHCKPPPRRILGRGPLVGAAIGFAFALLTIPLGVMADRWWNGVSETIATARGQQKILTLADGSKVVLDAGSEITHRIGYRRRNVTLVRGEALFAVTHDESRPFAVTAGAGRIVDLGTRFNVEMQHGHVHVAVLEGKVDIGTPHGRVALDAGQGVGFDNAGAVSPVVPVDATAAAWQEGLRVFRNEPLGEVLERLVRYYPVHFDLADPALADLRISGIFRITDLNLFLKTLEAGFPVRAQIQAPDRVILRRAAAS